MLVRYTFLLFGSVCVDSAVFHPKTEWPWDKGGRGTFSRTFCYVGEKIEESSHG